MAENKKKMEEEKLQAENQSFWGKLADSDDLNDNLTELCNYLHKNMGATGVYISKLEPKMKPIADDAGENDHIDEEAPQVLKFKHANTDHQKLMVGAVLNPNQGISHQLFQPANEEEEAPAEEEDEDKPKEKDTDDILKTYPHKYVSHVVRQKDIHFWRVPRLGAFMAIPLIYKSCLSEEALDAAITNWSEVSKQIEAQETKKAEWEDEQAQIKEQKLAAGEEYEKPEEPWQEIQADPFKSVEKKFVICIDTLGQDNELTDEQKRFALKTAQDFKNAWEKFENDKIISDRDKRILVNITDKEWNAEHLDKIIDEEQKFVEDKLSAIEDEIQDEDHRSLVSNKFRLEFQSLLMKEREEFKTRIDDFKGFKVIKYGKFL